MKKETPATTSRGSHRGKGANHSSPLPENRIIVNKIAKYRHKVHEPMLAPAIVKELEHWPEMAIVKEHKGVDHG